jgi:hypothetical protein
MTAADASFRSYQLTDALTTGHIVEAKVNEYFLSPCMFTVKAKALCKKYDGFDIPLSLSINSLSFQSDLDDDRHALRRLKRTKCEKCRLYTLRIFINFIVLVLLGAGGYLIYWVSDKSLHVSHIYAIFTRHILTSMENYYSLPSYSEYSP